MSVDPREINVESAANVPGAPAAKGTSLGHDAWRRLRRNRMAMFSLVTLVTIALLAFFTPLLPLAAPDKHHTDCNTSRRKLTPLFVNTFSLNWKAIEETPAKLALFTKTWRQPNSGTTKPKVPIRRQQQGGKESRKRSSSHGERGEQCALSALPRSRFSGYRPCQPLDDSHSRTHFRWLDDRLDRRAR